MNSHPSRSTSAMNLTLQEAQRLWTAVPLARNESNSQKRSLVAEAFGRFVKVAFRPAAGEGCPVYRPETKGESGIHCERFLNGLDRLAHALGVPTHSRTYRKTFTKNYTALFPDSRRHYRVDVLEAAVDEYGLITVNHEDFTFSPSVLSAAKELSSAWTVVVEMFRHIITVAESVRTHTPQPPTHTLEQTVACLLSETPSRVSVSELTETLVTLDEKWAVFENRYISELIEIEKRARRFVLLAVELEEMLTQAEGGVCVEGETLESLVEKLTRQIFTLNSIANYRGTGRSDLTFEVLMQSERLLELEHASAPSHSLYAPVSGLARACVCVWEEFRVYFRECKIEPEKIDPHLCNNARLVSLLVKIEHTWGVGQTYLLDPEACRCLIAAVNFSAVAIETETRHIENTKRTLSPPSLLAAPRALGGGEGLSVVTGGEKGGRTHTYAPPHPSPPPQSYEEKLLDCDVEAVLAVPRLLVMYYCVDPASRLHVLAHFMPSLIREIETETRARAGAGGEAVCECVPGSLRPVVSAFLKVQYELVVGCGLSMEECVLFFFRTLTGGETPRDMETRVTPRAREYMSCLLPLIETVSMNMQRACPKQWNEFMQVYTDCLTHTLDLTRAQQKRNAVDQETCVSAPRPPLDLETPVTAVPVDMETPSPAEEARARAGFEERNAVVFHSLDVSLAQSPEFVTPSGSPRA